MAEVIVPECVRVAQLRSQELGFKLSCEDVAGRLLATLAAAVPLRGRILEIGTGVGVGTAWIVSGLGSRQDVELFSVEVDLKRFEAAISQTWPSFVHLVLGSIFDLYNSLGHFDLIFADSGAGKWDGREQTIAALKPGGILVMDDMTPPKWNFDQHEALNEEVRKDLLNRTDLSVVELNCATGILIASKNR